ncbi:MAG: glycosyltransferase WbuB, partial [Chitinivibrionales bacterium]|nr:glycosyltransferase WbuB [Chitinivibrionales bacterium]
MKKKACMVAYAFYEPDNRVRRYAETLVNEGWDVDAIVLRQDGSPARATVKGVNVFKIQKRNFSVKGKSSYLRNLLGFFFHSMAFLTKQCFTRRYDIIHVHSVPDFEIFAALFTKLFGAKLILDIHD